LREGNVAGLSELDDEALQREYRWAIKRLINLDPKLPKSMHEIRAKYRDYIRAELVARGLPTSNTNGARHGRVIVGNHSGIQATPPLVE
jgi:hypothetical protein